MCWPGESGTGYTFLHTALDDHPLGRLDEEGSPRVDVAGVSEDRKVVIRKSCEFDGRVVDLAPEDVKLMFKTACIVLRDTGRRPRELCELRADCLEFDDGEYSLLRDDRKARRPRRRLPIASQTVEAIKRWL